MSAFWGYLAIYASHVQKICLDETHRGFVEQCFKPTESFTQQSGMFTQQETCMCIAVIWSCVYIYIYKYKYKKNSEQLLRLLSMSLHTRDAVLVKPEFTQF